MRKITRSTAQALLVASFLLALVVPSATASKNQRSIIEDSGRTLSSDPQRRATALDESAALGADILKLPVTWRSYAPDGESSVKPSGDLTDPAAYPAGTWDLLDSVVSGAESRGMRVWMMITAPAPRWAVAKETSPGLGAYLPDPTDFADFVKAVGRRYRSVHYFSFWNEVNIKRFMQPVTRSIRSAPHYREMYLAGQSALNSSGHRRDTLTFGELMPRSQVYDRNATRPIAWLREFFCLDRRGKALRGRTARRHRCNGFKRIRTSGLAYHPYRLTGSPLSRETSPDNAAIGHMRRVHRVLDQAYKAKHLSSRKLRIYNTEFGFQTDPPDPRGKSLATSAHYLNVSEYLSWLDPRIVTYSQYLIVDDPDLSAFQTGLRFADGTVKPVYYDAYVTPLVVMRTRSKNRVAVWGALRGKRSGPVTAELQIADGSAWVKARGFSVKSSTGYYTLNLARRGASTERYRIVWDGGASRSARPERAPQSQRD